MPDTTQNKANQDSERVVQRMREDIKNLDKDSLRQIGREIYQEGRNKGLTPTDFGWNDTPSGR